MPDYRVIDLGGGYDVTVTPSNAATVWYLDTPVKSLPKVCITYTYKPGDNHIHKAIRDGSDAVEFIITAWIYGRTILDVQFEN